MTQLLVLLLEEEKDLIPSQGGRSHNEGTAADTSRFAEGILDDLMVLTRAVMHRWMSAI